MKQQPKKETPKSAKSSRRHYQLWKMIEKMKLEEIEFLVTKRKNDLKYETNPDEIRNLRTDICILEDAYNIIKKRKRR